MFHVLGKNITTEQLWKKVRSLIKEGHLPCCNAKLQVSSVSHVHHAQNVGKVCIQANWPIRSELIPISLA